MAKTSKAKSKVKKTIVKSKVSVKAAAKPAPAVKKIMTSAKAAPAPKAVEKKIVMTKKEMPVIAAPVPVIAKKPEKLDFTAGDFVVYPAHGVGFVEGVETQMIAGMEITLYTISFEKDRMRLKLPISKVKASGLRKLSSKDRLKDALSTLQGRSQTRRIMWSRRAQEYEAKINSGDLISIAEVVRDLHRASGQPEQSYSERQLYEAALARMAREVAAVERIDEDAAVKRLETALQRAA